MDVALKDNRVQFGDRFSVSLHRTLRILMMAGCIRFRRDWASFPLRSASTSASARDSR